MPFSEQHQRKKYKNYAFLIGLGLLIALFYTLPFIKLAHGS